MHFGALALGLNLDVLSGLNRDASMRVLGVDFMLDQLMMTSCYIVLTLCLKRTYTGWADPFAFQSLQAVLKYDQRDPEEIVASEKKLIQDIVKMGHVGWSADGTSGGGVAGCPSSGSNISSTCVLPADNQGTEEAFAYPVHTHSTVPTEQDLSMSLSLSLSFSKSQNC